MVGETIQQRAGEPVSSFPNHDQRLSHRFVVDAPALFYRLLLPIVAGLPQQPDAMLAMVGRSPPDLSSAMNSSRIRLFSFLDEAR